MKIFQKITKCIWNIRLTLQHALLHKNVQLMMLAKTVLQKQIVNCGITSIKVTLHELQT